MSATVPRFALIAGLISVLAVTVAGCDTASSEEPAAEASDDSSTDGGEAGGDDQASSDDPADDRSADNDRTDDRGGDDDPADDDPADDDPADDDPADDDPAGDDGDDRGSNPADDDPADDPANADDPGPPSSTVCDGVQIIDPATTVTEVSLPPSDLDADTPWACGSQKPALGHDVLLQITPDEDVAYRATVLNGFYHQLRVLTSCPTDCADLPPAKDWATEYILWLDAGTTYVIAASLQPMNTLSGMPVGLHLEKMSWDADAPGQGCDAPIELTGADLPAEVVVSTVGLAPDLDTSCLPEVSDPVDFAVAFTPDVTGTYDLEVTGDTSVFVVHSSVCEQACSAPWNKGPTLKLNLEAGHTSYFLVQVDVPPGMQGGIAPDVTLTISDACIPHCDGKQCGDDGCGQSCGTCGSYLWCEPETATCVIDELICSNDPYDPHYYPPGGCILAEGCEELPIHVPWDYSYDYSSGSVDIPIEPTMVACDPNAATALSFGWDSYHPGYVTVENGWQLLDWNAGEFFAGAPSGFGAGDMLMEPWTVGPTVLKLDHTAAPGPVRVEFEWGGGVNLLKVAPWIEDAGMPAP